MSTNTDSTGRHRLIEPATYSRGRRYPARRSSYRRPLREGVLFYSLNTGVATAATIGLVVFFSVSHPGG